jgi:hypothetical protein
VCLRSYARKSWSKIEIVAWCLKAPATAGGRYSGAEEPLDGAEAYLTPRLFASLKTIWEFWRFADH